MRQMPCGLNHYEEPHFIDWYYQAAGESLVPPVYNLWCGISLVAATLVDRVWIERKNRPRLYPNLFTMLIGPSGTGKDSGIERATTLVRSLHDVEQDRIRIFEGKTTVQALLDHFADTKGKASQGSYFIWLVTPELRMQVGSGPKAADFVSHSTELYKTGIPFQDRTRTNGYITIDKFCLNWISGTTPEWLIESVGLPAIYSGFFARICAIYSDPMERVPVEPIYPRNKEEIDAWLLEYIQELAYMQGQMTVSKSAFALRKQWFETREPSDDPLTHGFFRHCDTILQKLAIVFAAADNMSYVIERRHMQDAITLTEWLAVGLPDIMHVAATAPDRAEVDYVSAWLAKNASKAPIDHSTALHAASNRGIRRDRFREIIATLVESGFVEKPETGGRRTYYQWIKERSR